jgi:hypothetical protein
MLNLNEIGISDWEERKTMRVIVPAAMLGQTIHHGVSRNVKHISVIACLSTAGESILHYIMTLPNSPTVQEHLNKQGVRFGSDFALKLTRILTSTLASSSPISEPSAYHILFGVLKRCPRYEMPFDENNATVNVITKVYHDFTQTIVQCNVCRAFRAL